MKFPDRSRMGKRPKGSHDLLGLHPELENLACYLAFKDDATIATAFNQPPAAIGAGSRSTKQFRKGSNSDTFAPFRNEFSPHPSRSAANGTKPESSL